MHAGAPLRQNVLYRVGDAEKFGKNLWQCRASFPGSPRVTRSPDYPQAILGKVSAFRFLRIKHGLCACSCACVVLICNVLTFALVLC